MFQRHAGGVADKAVGVGKVWNRQRNGFSGFCSGPVECLEALPQQSLRSAGCVFCIGWCCRLIARIRYAIEFALPAPATHCEIHRPVTANRHVGQRQWGARNKFFLRGLVGRAIRIKVDCIHRAECPIADVESLLVFGGKLCPVAKRCSHRRARTNVDQRRQAVGKCCGPLPRTAAPAEFTAAGGMIHARGPIPRRSEIPFHVGVVDK